ncbi:LamG domain-containing protein [Streptomyces sp. WM6378]|uniref:LamG domain-containing protein n=1 Tax=Streptomyces sp. WM6378 TaxID=1415557 RepID=UPI0006AE5EBC|nr:LamG domain-containing protein [Streptomyces sp. WM6378]
MDRVVRVLATSCERANRGVPVAYAVVLGPDTVRFHLKNPDERPPAGWTAESGGRTWHAQLHWLHSASVAESLREPYPQLVSLGHTSKGFVLLNLSQAGGIVALEGDSRQARALAEDWTGELTASPWSQGVQVVRIGFKPGAAEPAAGTIEVKSLAEAEAALSDEGGGVLLLSGLPGGRDRERVYTLANDPEGRWSVVVADEVEHPRWRFTIDPAGIVNTGLLDEPVAHRLNADLGAPVPVDADANAAQPQGAAVPGSRRAERRFTRRRVIVASVVVACLLGTGLTLGLRGTSSPSAPVGQASKTPGTQSKAPADAANIKGQGWWPTEEGKGATAKDGAGRHDARLEGGVSWTDAPKGKALLFDGSTGFADTGAPIIDTAKGSYSVTARVRLDAEGFRTAVSQDSETASTFYLQYLGDERRFSFSFANARAVARDLGPAQLGRWYHLTGTYSQSDGWLRIYVDGKHMGAVQARNTETATGNLVIGRGKSFGKLADFWPGAITDVHVFQRTLKPWEIAKLATAEPK